MKVCKWKGDASDEYCKSCNGVTMMVDGKELSCIDCAGYEPGEEDADVPKECNNEIMTEPVVDEPKKETTKSASKTKETKKTTNNIKKEKTNKTEVKNEDTNNKSSQVVSTDKQVSEQVSYTPNGIQITSLRYTSSATVKKGDNYYKFTAEEEWSTVLYTGNIDDVREQLWAKLNSEVDKQIEDLQNM